MAAPKSSGPTYESIMRDIAAHKLEKVYFLEGTEGYFIDKIAEAVTSAALTNDQKDFNQIVYYGADVSVGQIINTAKSYPLGADRLVVEVREAQLVDRLDDLMYYLQYPLDSTILIICYKNGTIDRRKRLAMLVEKQGVLFEAKKMRDSQLTGFISVYLKQKNVVIDNKAAVMLADYVGADLSRLSGELDKLVISLPQGQKSITPAMIEQNIGVSKDFNYFELQNALVEKNVYKANQIAQYFADNPKANPLQVTLIMLFRFFSKLMLSYYAPDKSLRGLATWLGMSEWQARDNILPAMRHYSGRKVMEIIEKIRETDARSKGIDNVSVDERGLLTELVFFILH